MKVAHLNCVYEYGSTGKLIKEIVDEGQKYGIENRVFYSEGSAEDERGIRYITDVERNIHAVLSRLTGLQGYWSKNVTKKLIKQITEFQPDIIHLHTLHGNCIHLPLLFQFLEERNYPVVLTLHDCWWFTGRCAHPLAYECKKWEKKEEKHCISCPAQKDVCPSWFFDKAAFMLEEKKRFFKAINNLYVVCVSDWLKQQVEYCYVFNNIKKIDRIYNWIDTSIFRGDLPDAQLEDLKSGKKMVLGVASIFLESKGFSDFLWLSQHLSKEYQIVLVGNIEEGKELPENIIHVSSTSNKEELAALYRRADVFVNPSSFETFGLTTVEAMACGTPVVLYEFSTSREVVGENCGRIVPLGEKEQLLKAIVEVCSLGKEQFTCAEWVRDRFEKKNGVAKYVEIYKKAEKNKC